MTRQEIINVCINIVEDMRSLYVPRRTGNLAYNAIVYDVVDDEFIIQVDPSIAPYMPYTNEPWLSPKWHGKKNPNEGWWQKFCEEFSRRLANELRGEISQ